MPNIMAGSMGGFVPPIDGNQLMIMSVVVNNSCNLRCRHCYLEPRLAQPRLTAEEWSLFFDSVFRDLRPSVVTFAGKEVFADEQSAKVVFRAVEQRDIAQPQITERTRIGLITNGTLLHGFRRRLLDASPDWVDVSIDGLPAAHDAVRGTGAFEQLEPNLFWLAKVMPERVWITHTLMDHNVDYLDEFVRFFNDRFGLCQFSIGAYKPLPYTDHGLALRGDERNGRIVGALKRLVEIRPSSPLRVHLECDLGDTLQAAMADQGMELEGWPLAQWTRHFDNGLTLVVGGMLAPVGLWRAVRVTAEGYWLAAEDLIDAKRYRDVAVGSLRDQNFDAVKLYDIGLRHPRFEELTGMTSDAFLQRVRRAS